MYDDVRLSRAEIIQFKFWNIEGVYDVDFQYAKRKVSVMESCYNKRRAKKIEQEWFS